MDYDDVAKKFFVLAAYLSKRELGQLYEAILKNLPTFRNKWDLVRFVYNFVVEKHGSVIATKVAWCFTRHFEKLFERGRYVNFYLPTLECVKLFEAFANANTSEMHNMAKTAHQIQLNLISAFSRVQGVRV